MKGLKSSRRAFTLIELLVCLAILGILIAAGLSAYSHFTGDGNSNSTKPAPIWMNHGERTLYNQNQQTQQKLDEANRLEAERLRLERERLELEKERLRMQEGNAALLE